MAVRGLFFFVSAGTLPAVGTSQTMPYEDVPAFRIPQLRGMNMYPARAIINRHVVVRGVPWLHFHTHCAIANGNMYIDGSVTNNSNQAVPDVVVYFMHHGSTILQLTSDMAGGYHGAVPLSADAIAIVPSPGTEVTRFDCVAPNVRVGKPLRASDTKLPPDSSHLSSALQPF